MADMTATRTKAMAVLAELARLDQSDPIAAELFRRDVNTVLDEWAAAVELGDRDGLDQAIARRWREANRLAVESGAPWRHTVAASWAGLQ